jgi:hypothetical protein
MNASSGQRTFALGSWSKKDFCRVDIRACGRALVRTTRRDATRLAAAKLQGFEDPLCLCGLHAGDGPAVSASSGWTADLFDPRAKVQSTEQLERLKPWLSKEDNSNLDSLLRLPSFRPDRTTGVHVHLLLQLYRSPSSRRTGSRRALTIWAIPRSPDSGSVTNTPAVPCSFFHLSSLPFPLIPPLVASIMSAADAKPLPFVYQFAAGEYQLHPRRNSDAPTHQR